jgi:hypothetical protein
VHVLTTDLAANSLGAASPSDKYRIAVDAVLHLDHHSYLQSSGADAAERLRRNLESVTDMHVIQVIVKVLVDSLMLCVGRDQHVRL